MDTIFIESPRRPSIWVRIAAAGAINLLGLWIAGALDLVTYRDDFWVLLLAALVLAAVNLIVRPLALVLSIPFIIVTFGLFILIVNAVMLWLTDKIVPDFDTISFWRTIGAAVILGIANIMLGGAMKDFTERPRRERHDLV
jgi:putative membrane protein